MPPLEQKGVEPVGETRAPASKAQKPMSVLRRRWRKFRALKRGWYSFLLLLGLYLVSFANPLLINSRALIVKHEGRYHFPAFGTFYSAKDFGQRRIGEVEDPLAVDGG
jgi:ABC-type microcin C transport system permease subunit YejE